jgi:peptidyl-prolyl cis-trans isomerase C
MPIRRQSIALALVAAVACLSVLSATAQPASDPVLAKVNGVEIRESNLALAEADIGQSLPPGATEARRDALLAYLIDVTILATAAEAQKMQDAPGFVRKLAFVRSKVLMEALLDQATKGAVTEEAMRKLYEESVSKLTPEEEVRARHILVDSEDKAKEVIAKLKAGGDFAALAKEYSKDPGAAEGGDLGYFTKDQMVAEFAEAAFKMKPGDISDRVKTQFGWHVIKLEDRRQKPVPPFEQVKDQIEQFLVRKAQSDLVLKLRESAKIERTTPPAQTPAPAVKGKK